MADGDGGLWHTLARIYAAVLACGICVPSMAAVPVLLGADSLLAALCFGGFGLAVAGGIVVLVDAQLTAAVVGSGPRAARAEPGGDAAGTAESGRT
jgi:hypothetical protein